MSTPVREWRFGDWLAVFLRAVPAFVLAVALLLLPVAALLTLAWWSLPFTAR